MSWCWSTLAVLTRTVVSTAAIVCVVGGDPRWGNTSHCDAWTHVSLSTTLAAVEVGRITWDDLNCLVMVSLLSLLVWMLWGISSLVLLVD